MTESTTALRYVGFPEAKVLFDIGTAVFVDARDREEFERSRIPGARMMSVAEAPQRHFELPRDRLILVYGDSVRDVRPAAVVRILLGAGYIHAAVLEGGISSWREAGYPLESGAGETRGGRAA